MTPALLTAEDREELLGTLTHCKKEYAELSEAIKAGKPQGEILTRIDKIDEAMVAFQKAHQDSIKRADDLEAKIERKAAQSAPLVTIGRQVIEHPDFLAAIKGGGRFSVGMTLRGTKDILNVSRGLPEVIPAIAGIPVAPAGVRALMPQGRTTAGAVAYAKETAFTNNAAPVAEGAAKPKSDKTITTVSAPVETIAHYFKVSKQTLEDLPALEAMIDAQGTAGLKLKEDNQLLNGTGATPLLQGIMPLATAAPAVPSAPLGGTFIDAIGLAVFDLASKGYMADGTVVNPADWGLVSMQKNSQGNYLFANPLDYGANTRIWGTRLAQSANMAAGNFLVGAFAGHSLLLDREEVNTQVATMNEDDFIHNLVTILIEERLVAIWMVPAAFEKGVKPSPTMAEEAEAESQPSGRRR